MRIKDYGAYQDQHSLDWSINKDLEQLITDVCNQTDFDRSEAVAALRRVLNDPGF